MDELTQQEKWMVAGAALGGAGIAFGLMALGASGLTIVGVGICLALAGAGFLRR